MRLKNVPVPRENMLCRFAKVTKEGKYIPPDKKQSKLIYASMLTLRVYFTAYSAWYIGCASTVAIRYSVQRTQFRKEKGKPEERKLLDYQSQQAKLFPVLASTWAFSITAFDLRLRYRNFLAGVLPQSNAGGKFKKGSFQMLPDLHASASCLKAYMSDLALEHINTSLHACGGHGFLI